MLKRSREIQIRLQMHSDHAAKLKESIEQSRKRTASHAYFCPE